MRKRLWEKRLPRQTCRDDRALDFLRRPFGLEQRAAQRFGIFDAGFELELVADDGHENSAASTACVSLRSWKTCAAPAVRSAATLKNPVATATARAPVGLQQLMSSGVSPTITMSLPVKRRPVCCAARSAATAGRSGR